jgi:hypothetical protein
MFIIHQMIRCILDYRSANVSFILAATRFRAPTKYCHELRSLTRNYCWKCKLWCRDHVYIDDSDVCLAWSFPRNVTLRWALRPFDRQVDSLP